MIALLPLLALADPSSMVPETYSAPTYPTLALAPARDVPEMEYTYIELNYIWTDNEEVDETLDGGELTGSLELPLNFFAQLTVSRQSDDADLDTYRIGAGYHLPIGSRLDAFGIVSYAHAEVDGSSNDFDDSGTAGELGLRFLLRPKLELNGSAEWVDVEEDDFGIGVGARFYLIDRFSLGGRVESLDDDLTFAVGARFEL